LRKSAAGSGLQSRCLELHQYFSSGISSSSWSYHSPIVHGAGNGERKAWRAYGWRPVRPAYHAASAPICGWARAWTAIEAIHHETESSQAPPATAQPFEQRQQEELDRRNRKADGMRKELEQGN
jgi:hypothetical protein